MIPLGVVLVLAAGCFLAGWMARAEHGRGIYTSGPKPVSQLRPPPTGPGLGARRARPALYDWSQDPDL